MNLIEAIKKYNRWPVDVDTSDPYRLYISSQHSLFRLGTFLDGWISCYNATYGTYKVSMTLRSKYYVELTSNSASTFK